MGSLHRQDPGWIQKPELSELTCRALQRLLSRRQCGDLHTEAQAAAGTQGSGVTLAQLSHRFGRAHLPLAPMQMVEPECDSYFVSACCLCKMMRQIMHDEHISFYQTEAYFGCKLILKESRHL